MSACLPGLPTKQRWDLGNDDPKKGLLSCKFFLEKIMQCQITNPCPRRVNNKRPPSLSTRRRQQPLRAPPPPMDAPRAARLAVAARPPSPRAPARFPFASSTAPRREGRWWCARDPRADSSGGGSTFPSPGRCSRPALALAHRNRSPAANLGLPPHRPARSPAAGIGTRVTGDGGCDCDGPPLVECAGDRPIQEPAGGQSRHVSASLLPRLLLAVSIQCAAPLADRGARMRVDCAEFQI